jgi:excisionase family DNA binding protein
MIGVEKSLSPETEVKTPCLAMRLRAAAKALGVSERLLWELTDRGEIPHVRLGRAICYPTDALRRWLEQHVQQSAADREKKSEKILE